MAKRRKANKKKKGMGLFGKVLIVLTIGFGMGIGASYYAMTKVHNFSESVVESIIEEM